MSLARLFRQAAERGCGALAIGSPSRAAADSGPERSSDRLACGAMAGLVDGCFRAVSSNGDHGAAPDSPRPGQPQAAAARGARRRSQRPWIAATGAVRLLPPSRAVPGDNQPGAGEQFGDTVMSQTRFEPELWQATMRSPTASLRPVRQPAESMISAAPARRAGPSLP